MHAGRLALALLALVAAAGCLGVDNMRDFKTELGAHEVPDPPQAVFDVSPASVLPGETVAFTAAPSADPLGAGLDHAWDLGDGTRAQGRSLEHVYADPGDYTVTLTVTDDRGRSDQAREVVAVGTPNRAPEASVAATTPSGDPVDEVQVGSAVLLSAEEATDPDGDPLTYRWHLGDGTTATGADVGHSYDQPGLHTVTVTVSDPQGASDEARLVLPVTLARTWDDSLTAPNSTASHPFPVATGAEVTANLSFPAGPLGGNDLDLAVVDAEGDVVARSNASTPVGASGPQHEEVTVPPSLVDDHDPGAWSARVERTAGGDVDYTLSVDERFPAAG